MKERTRYSFRFNERVEKKGTGKREGKGAEGENTTPRLAQWRANDVASMARTV
jgi:hypothetical protein